MWILALRPGAIGDTLVTLPALLTLRRRFPESRIQLVGNPAVMPLVGSSGIISDWLSFDHLRVTHLFSGRGPTCSDPFLRINMAVAWCADPDGVLRRGLIWRGAKAPIIVPSRPAPGRIVHVARHLLETLEPLGVDPTQALCLPKLALPGDAEEAARRELGAAGLGDRPFIALHPGSGSTSKNWPVERFATVADELQERYGLPSLIFGGPADVDVLARLGAAMRTAPRLLVDAPLVVVAAILRRSRAFLGNDSGLSHLAGLLGVPTLALFGPTEPAHWSPLGPRVRTIKSDLLADLGVERVLAELTSPFETCV